MRFGGSGIVSCPDYFSPAQTAFCMRRGKIVWSTAYSIFVLCGFKIGDTTSLKIVSCDVTRSLKLRKSSKETACCRNHVSRSFRTPRNEDSQNVKHLTTSESPETILLPALKLTNFTRPVFKLRNTHRLFTESLESLRLSFSGSVKNSLGTRLGQVYWA